jgi:hypothetical protein
MFVSGLVPPSSFNRTSQIVLATPPTLLKNASAKAVLKVVVFGVVLAWL